jgi:ketosteroid isomerase-like protein
VSADVHQAGVLPFRTAMEAGDVESVVAAFAPDAVFRSPVTGRLAFRGHDQIAAVTSVILDVVEDFRYTGELRDGDRAILLAKARIGGKDIEMADSLRLGPEGKITELTVFFRPLPASAVALRVIAAGLARRKGRVRSAAISLMTRPLGFMAQSGDRVGARFVRSLLP